MSWQHDPDLQEALAEFDIDAEDQALLDHVLGDDRPPQGLHRGGLSHLDDDLYDGSWN